MLEKSQSFLQNTFSDVWRCFWELCINAWWRGDYGIYRCLSLSVSAAINIISGADTARFMLRNALYQVVIMTIMERNKACIAWRVCENDFARLLTWLSKEACSVSQFSGMCSGNVLILCRVFVNKNQRNKSGMQVAVFRQFAGKNADTKKTVTDCGEREFFLSLCNIWCGSTNPNPDK